MIRESLAAALPQLRWLASVGYLPADFLSVDIETTGFAAGQDLIVAVGWVVCRGGAEVLADGYTLDWTRRAATRDFVRQRLAALAEKMAAKGRVCHYTYERLEQEGVEPLDGLDCFDRLLWDYPASILGHNIWRFDRTRIDAAVRNHLRRRATDYRERLVDVGLLLKACQDGLWPTEGESRDAWHNRVSYKYSRTKWSLSHVADECQLRDAGTQRGDDHQATADARLAARAAIAIRSML